MPVFKDKTREITVKIVYYGPPMAGKSTSLNSLHRRIDQERRGEMHIWGNEADTILDFDLLPLSLDEIKKYKLLFQVHTVPGQVKSNRTRKFILEGVDAIVFVADSQRSRKNANLVSFGNLKQNLRVNQLNLDDIPVVYVYNKRDLKNILTIAELNQDLNPTDRCPYVETVAIQGTGVVKTFEIISNLVIRNLTMQLQHIEEEISSDHDELPELLGLPGLEEESFDFAAELEPVTSEDQQTPPLSYADLISETYHDGEIIFEQGDAGDRMYFVESGQVKIVASDQRTTKVLAMYHKGEFFGEMALFGKHLRSARALAVGTTNLLPVTQEKLASQIHNRPELAESLLETLANRIQTENKTIGKLLEQNKELRKHLQKAQEMAKHAAEPHEGLNIVDFAFKHGIDWQAFLVSLQQIHQQITVKNKEAEIIVQCIEKKEDGGFVVKIAVTQGLNKGKIYQAFLAHYKRQLVRQRAKYHILWQGQDQVIARCRQQGADMQKILHALSQKQALNMTMAQAVAEKNLAHLPQKDLKHLYTLLSQKIGELRRIYIHKSEPAIRSKLKKQIKEAEVLLTKIEHRLNGLQTRSCSDNN